MKKLLGLCGLLLWLGFGYAQAATCAIGSSSYTCFTNSDGNFALTSNPAQPTATGTVWNSSTSGSTTQSVISAVGSPAVSIQYDITTTISGGAITIQGTRDNTNWETVPAGQIFIPSVISTVATNPYTLVASTNKPFIVWMGGYQSLRLNLSTAITGSGSVTPFFTALNTFPQGQLANQTAGCMHQSPVLTGVAQINQITGTQLLNGVSGQAVYICAINLISATTQNVALVEGTGSVCASSTLGMAGGSTAATGWSLAANNGLTIGNGVGMVAKTVTNGDAVCLLQSSTGQVSGNIVYAQAP